MTTRPEPARSIRQRLLTLLVLPAILVLLAGTVVDYLARRGPVRDAYDAVLLDTAIALATNVHADADQRITAVLPPAALNVLRTDSLDSIYFRISGPDGAFIAGDQDLPQLATALSNPSYTTLAYRGQPVRVVTYRTQTSAGFVNTVVAETQNKREKVRTSLWTTALLTDVVELAAILAVVWIGVRLAMRPLGELQQQIASRKPGDLEPLPQANVPVELRSVVDELNRLFATIAAGSRTQKQFLENAAHQLRTPLAGMQAQIELLMVEETAQARRERLALALAATRRLAHTTQQLLALARSEAGIYQAGDFVPVDLDLLAERCVSDHLSGAIAAGIELAAALQPVKVRAVGWLLGEALNNIVDNAIKYTPRGGLVEVRCGTEHGVPYVEVADTGAGIPAHDRERVTQRFVRGRDAQGEGSGLGLAIVSDIARLHGAALNINAGPQQVGTVMRLDFLRDREPHDA